MGENWKSYKKYVCREAAQVSVEDNKVSKDAVY